MTPEPRKIEGQWWAPDSPRKRRIGTLTVDALKGLRLDLTTAHRSGVVGAFKDEFFSPEAKVMYGVSEHGHPITLCFCGRTSTNSAAILANAEYHVGYAFLGYRFKSWADVRLDKVQITYTHLDEWLNRSGFTFSQDAGHGVSVTYTRPDTLRFPIGKDFIISFCTSSSGPNRSVAQTDVTMKQSQHVELEFSRPRSMSSILDIAEALCRFLTLGVGKSVEVLTLHGQKHSHRLPLGGDFYHPQIEVLGVRRHSDRDSRKTLPFEMVFAFDQVRGTFGDVFTKWLSYREQFQAVLACYFAVLFNKHLYVTHQFILLAQALEVYHRIKFPGGIESTADFRKRVRRVLEAVPDADKDWVKENLQWANERRLVARLEQLYDEKQAILSAFLGDKTKFATLVRDTRNYYTHYREELKNKGKVADGAALFRLTDDLRVFLEVCILSDLGLPDTTVRKVVKRDWQYMEYK